MSKKRKGIFSCAISLAVFLLAVSLNNMGQEEE
jgi:hypothetical protein